MEKRNEKLKFDENGDRINGEQDQEQSDNRYRYRNNNNNKAKKDSLNKKKLDSLKTLVGLRSNTSIKENEKKELVSSDSSTPLRNLLMVFQ
jgi:hypothetical protein